MGAVVGGALAVIPGAGREIVAHTDWVLERFRGQTICQGYVGDRVLNAVADYGFMVGGFLAGAALPWRWGLALILAAEAFSAAMVRESLVLTTIRVVHPIPAIAAWQDAANPLRTPGLPPAD